MNSEPPTAAEIKWLREIVESFDGAVIVIDRDRIIRFANARAARFAARQSIDDILGVRYDNILAESRIMNEAGDVATPAEFPSTRVFIENAPIDDVRFEQIYRGKHLWMSITAIPIRHASGAPTHAIVRFLEISGRKKRRDQLQFLIESNKILSISGDFKTHLIQKARLMVPSLADWCTLNTVENGTLARIAVVHRDPAKVSLVESFAERAPSEAPGYSGVAAVLATGEAQLHERVEMPADTSPAWSALAAKLEVCSSMIIPITARGQVLGVLSLAYAESGRHYNREDLEFMQEFCLYLGILVDNMHLYKEVQKQDTAKDRFLAALSHELRNPLAPIKSTLELFRFHALGADAKQMLGVIEHQFDHLTKLLNDLLDVTRYSRGKIHIERTPVDLRDVVRESAEAARPVLDHKHVSFTITLPYSPTIALVDRTRIEQAVLNLLNNAEKFTPDGGRISLALTTGEAGAKICVSDTGAGMTAEELDDVFTLGGAGKNRGSGLGLGLLLVKEILELHGGIVTAESAGPGKGSSFTLTLPNLA